MFLVVSVVAVSSATVVAVAAVVVVAAAVVVAAVIQKCIYKTIIPRMSKYLVVKERKMIQYLLLGFQLYPISGFSLSVISDLNSASPLIGQSTTFIHLFPEYVINLC